MTVYMRLQRVIVSGVRSVHHVGLKAGLRTSCFYQTREEKHDQVVTREQLNVMLTNHSVQLFDVRNPDEFQAGCIPGSVNVPLGQLEESLKLSPELFEKVFKVKAPQKLDENIVFYCQRGRRSLTALEIAWSLGFSRTRHYAGGYCDWAEKTKQ